MFISPSINEAFKNGSGDFCFQNGEGFVFVSKHIITEEYMKEMEGKGFKYVPYLEVLELGRKEKALNPPNPEDFTIRGPYDQLDFDGASYNEAMQSFRAGKPKKMVRVK